MLPNLMDAVKVASALDINRSRHARGPAWQPRYFDRIVRSVREYNKTMEYLHLIRCAEDWSASPEDCCGQVSTLTVVRAPFACRWSGSFCRRTKTRVCEREGQRKGNDAGYSWNFVAQGFPRPRLGRGAVQAYGFSRSFVLFLGPVNAILAE
jgi:hypothetical protein